MTLTITYNMIPFFTQWFPYVLSCLDRRKQTVNSAKLQKVDLREEKDGTMTFMWSTPVLFECLGWICYIK